MALTPKQKAFLENFVLATSKKRLVVGGKDRKIAAKTKRSEEFAALQDKVFSLFDRLDKSSPLYATLQRQRDNVEGYGNQGKYADGKKFAADAILKLEKAVAEHPKQEEKPTRPTQQPPSNPLRQASKDNPIKTSVSLEEAKALLTAATGIHSQINPCGLDSPALVTTAIAEAQDLVDSAKSDKSDKSDQSDGLELSDALESFAAAEDKLWDFINQWKQAGVVERQARKEMPEKPAAMVAAIEVDWQTSRDQIGVEFSKLGPTANPGAVIDKLAQLQVRIERRRTSLNEILRGTASQIRLAREHYTELNQSKLYDLIDARKHLQNAESGFGLAADQGAIDAVLRSVRLFEQSLEKAKTDIPGEKLVALQKYQKLLHQLNLQILQAQKVRGALTEDSPVKKEIDSVIQLRNEAMALMAEAITVPMSDKAIIKLQACVDKKIPETAEKLAKNEKEQLEADTKALPGYQKAFESLSLARAELAGTPGAQAQLRAVELLISKTRVDGSGRPAGGFALALDTITKGDVAKLLKAAEQSSKDYLDNKLTGFAQGALEEAQKLLGEYAECHDASMLNAQREALAKATEPPEEAYRKLNALAITLRDSTKQQKELRQTLLSTAETRRQELDNLSKQGLKTDDPDLLVLNRQLETAKALIAEWQLGTAQQALKAIETGAADALSNFNAAKKDWDENKKQMEALRQLATPLLSAWNPLAAEAKSQIAWVTELIEGQRSGKFSTAEANQTASAFLKSGTDRLTTLMANAEVEATTDLSTFPKDLERVNKEWEKKFGVVQKHIDALDEKLKKSGVVKGASSMGWPAELASINLEWIAQCTEKLKLDSGKTPLAALEKAKLQMFGKLAEFDDGLPELDDTLGLTLAVGVGKAEETKLAKRSDFDRANGLLLELRSMNEALLPSNADTRLGVYSEEASKEQCDAWVTLAKELDGVLVQYKKSIQESITPHRTSASKLKESVKKKFLQFKMDKFRDFFDDLEQQIDDALSMLNATPPDPVLIKAAGEKLAAISKTVEDAKGKGGEDAVTLDMVLKVQGELNGLLGQASVLDRMPDTHKRLRDELDQSFKRAAGLSPDKGVEELEKLRGPILDAGTRALQLQLDYEGFKARLKEVKARFKEMQKHTGTTLGDRTKAYIEQFDAKLAEAQGIAHQEGKIEAGLAKLDLLDKGLGELLAMPPDQATEAVKSLNVEAESDQREVRDIAATFNATVAYWEDVLLPEVKSAVKKRGKEEEDGEYESLKGAVKSVGKAVEPYLAVISKLPHKRLMANASPDMSAMRTAFSQAYLQLNQLTQPALRLRDGAGSTNIVLETDMNKLNADWGKKVENAEQALAALAESAKRMAGMVVKDAQVGEVGYVPPEVLKELDPAINDLKSSLDKLSKQFVKSAFSGPLAKLADEGTTQQERKQAREEALRTARKLAGDIAGNPLLQKLYEGTRAGMVEVDIRPPISFLRSELKKIELAVLVGI